MGGRSRFFLLVLLLTHSLAADDGKGAATAPPSLWSRFTRALGISAPSEKPVVAPLDLSFYKEYRESYETMYPFFGNAALTVKYLRASDMAAPEDEEAPLKILFAFERYRDRYKISDDIALDLIALTYDIHGDLTDATMDAVHRTYAALHSDPEYVTAAMRSARLTSNPIAQDLVGMKLQRRAAYFGRSPHLSYLPDLIALSVVWNENLGQAMQRFERYQASTAAPHLDEAPFLLGFLEYQGWRKGPRAQ